jgi:nitrogen fixation protein FixH
MAGTEFGTGFRSAREAIAQGSGVRPRSEPASIRRRRSGAYWPWLIIALLAAGAGANVALLVVTARDTSFAVEPDYYRKALEWDATMAQQVRNATLGWSVRVVFEPAAEPGLTRLVARVTDRAGDDIVGAEVGIETFHSAHASHVLTANLAPESSGAYTATLPLDRSGLWEVRVRVVRGEQVFTASIDHDLPARP